MENEIELFFRKEDKTITLNIQQPDLANLVHRIIAEHLVVSKDNIEITTNNNSFDVDEFLELLIDVHAEFCEEIDRFYENIEDEIRTYYKDEELSEYVINKIKDIYTEDIKE